MKFTTTLIKSLEVNSALLHGLDIWKCSIYCQIHFKSSLIHFLVYRLQSWCLIVMTPIVYPYYSNFTDDSEKIRQYMIYCISDLYKGIWFLRESNLALIIYWICEINPMTSPWSKYKEPKNWIRIRIQMQNLFFLFNLVKVATSILVQFLVSKFRNLHIWMLLIAQTT